MSSDKARSLHNASQSMRELLQVVLEQPVYVSDGTAIIACLVSAQYFTEIGGVLARFGTEGWSAHQLAQHEIGQDDPDVCYQRFCRLVLHAAHATQIIPLLVNGLIIAVVVPPGGDGITPPPGPVITINRV
jgi:hypothetical protein